MTPISLPAATPPADPYLQTPIPADLQTLACRRLPVMLTGRPGPEALGGYHADPFAVRIGAAMGEPEFPPGIPRSIPRHSALNSIVLEGSAIGR